MVLKNTPYRFENTVAKGIEDTIGVRVVNTEGIVRKSQMNTNMLHKSSPETKWERWDSWYSIIVIGNTEISDQTHLFELMEGFNISRNQPLSLLLLRLR